MAMCRGGGLAANQSAWGLRRGPASQPDWPAPNPWLQGRQLEEARRGEEAAAAEREAADAAEREAALGAELAAATAGLEALRRQHAATQDALFSMQV